MNGDTTPRISAIWILLGEKDWHLLPRIIADEWTLVTNNVEEFRQRYGDKATLNPGAVFLVDVDAGRATQLAAFQVALDDIDLDGNLTNTEILVERDGDHFLVSRYDLPA